jgi:hypothetical protein
MKNVPYVLEYIYSRFHKYWLRIDENQIGL